MRFLIYSLLVLIINTSTYAQLETYNLNSHWTFHKKGETKNYPAQVPGSIYADLYRNQLIPNPFFGDNEKHLQWIEKETWVYECRFSLSEEELQSQNILLNLDGIDTYANIYLNDSLVLQTQSMFLAYHKEIKSLLKEKNSLRIEILPPLSQIPKNDSLNYPAGPQAHIRKAAFQFGWDWAPRYAAGGIWRGIRLEFSDKVQIDHVYFQLLKLDSTKALYYVFMDYDYEQIENYNLIISCQEAGILEKYHFEKPNAYYLTPFSIKIPNPKLWWPNGTGEAYRYNFNIRIEQDGKIIDQINQKIGIREIELVNEADSMGTSFYFKVNGKPVYIKGANYVPQDVFVGTEENKAYNSRKLIADVVKSNMNMIRIWGGGVYESDSFYDLCDSAGIIVWQDFMFANSVYPDDSAFLSLVKKEALQQVERLRHHPCITLWCGNNEVSEAWHNWGWQKQFGYSPSDSTRLWNNYRLLFDSIMPQTVAQFAPGTAYWQSSPEYGRGNPKSYSHGDLHYWGVWHDGHSFDSLETKTGRFMSEFGFQSYPSLNTIEQFSDKKSRNSKALQNHQKHSRGEAIINKYMMEEFGMVPDTFADFVYLSQILQSNGISKGLKAQRRNQPFCMGSMYWQLNDAWPAISWSGIDYYGNWKPLQYAVREAYQPYLIAHEIKGNSCSIYSISELSDSMKPLLRIRVMDFYGNSSFDTSFIASQEGQASKLQYQMDIQNIDPQKQFISVEAKSQNNQALYNDFIYLAKAKDLILPKPDLKITQNYSKGILTIELVSNTLIRNLCLERSNGKPVHFSQNNIDLLPGRRYHISLKTTDKNIELRWWSLNGVLGR